MDEHELGGLAELGHGIECVNEYIGHMIGEPFLKMCGCRLLYLLVGLEGVGNRAENLLGGDDEEHIGLLASWRRA